MLEVLEVHALPCPAVPRGGWHTSAATSTPSGSSSRAGATPTAPALPSGGWGVHPFAPFASGSGSHNASGSANPEKPR